MIYFTSDTHFGHKNIIEYCNRPFEDVDEMNAEMVRRWNRVVGPNDTVYHLGDFALGPKDKWREHRLALWGRIIFICGNHDEPRARWRKEVLLPGDEEHESLFVTTQYGTVHMAHVPPGGDPNRNLSRAGNEKVADFYLCSHIHNAWTRKKNVINVGVDVWDFTPRSLIEILRYCG